MWIQAAVFIVFLCIFPDDTGAAKCYQILQNFDGVIPTLPRKLSPRRKLITVPMLIYWTLL